MDEKMIESRRMNDKMTDNEKNYGANFDERERFNEKVANIQKTLTLEEKASLC